MPQNLEIEKKFIIRYPDETFLKSLPDCTFTHIEQIYLASKDGVSERIRKRWTDSDIKYYHTVKEHISNTTRIENERLITEEDYNGLIKRADPKLNAISKIRYCIPFDGHIMEIDVFPFWKNQAYLEVELSDENEEISVPQYIEILCDVTDDRRYTNHSLAQKIPDEI